MTFVWEIQHRLPTETSLATVLDPAVHSVTEHNSELQGGKKKGVLHRQKKKKPSRFISVLCMGTVEAWPEPLIDHLR